MTFEEFIAKKKIDLVQFEKAEPSLFSEFKSHFHAMGEKSFDHTKKFWFNKLRRLYHLSSPAKALTQTETAIASQSEPLSSPTMEQNTAAAAAEPQVTSAPKPAFRPRNISAKPAVDPKSAETSAEEPKQPSKPAFRPRNIPTKTVDENLGQKQVESSDEQPKAVNKPSFNPRNIPTKPVEDVPPELTSETPASPAINKPGFKPRNMPVKPSADVEGSKPVEEAKSEGTEAPKKPGFKPRSIKPADQQAVDAQKVDSRPGQTEVSETPIVDENKVEEAAKQGYKPKFKLKNIARYPAAGEEQTGQSTKQEIVPEATDSTTDGNTGEESTIERNISSSTEKKTPEQEIQDNDLDLRGSDDKSNEEKPKPAYKPRFNLKNIKPKADNDENL